MQLTFQSPQEHRTDPKKDVHNCYTYGYWNVELDFSDWDLSKELAREDVWRPEFPGSEGRQTVNPEGSDILNNFCQTFDQNKHMLVSQAFNDFNELFGYRWFKGLDFYINNTNILTTIFKDRVGFSCPPHLDNSHIILQLIINLMDNGTGTEFYDYLSAEPFAQGSSQQGQGVAFLNMPGSIHGVRNITQTRYILYSQITI